MAVLLWWLAGDVGDWLAIAHWQRLFKCLGGIALAAVVYFAVLIALGFRLRDLRADQTP
jgi:peptidoglycan biosynthesis protein MviN/MurJ (putative lipid II flippase)